MYTIGIDLGGTNIAVGVVDSEYKIIHKGSVPTGAKRHPDEILADMGKLVLDEIKAAGLTLADIESAGIASPGTVNGDKGEVEYANSLPFRSYPICAKLTELTGIKKVYIDNDANAAALGEYVAGAAKGAKNSVFITLGTGVGGGIIIDGKVYSGSNFAGGELGHMVIEYNGVPCSCGRRGCWESYSSATALIRMSKEAMNEDKSSKMWDIVGGNIDKVDGRTSFDAMRAGDASAKAVVDKYLSYLACGITNVINIFQPSIISIGGGISNEKSGFIEPLIKLVRAQEYGAIGGVTREFTQIKVAQLKNDAGIIGAAALK